MTGRPGRTGQPGPAFAKAPACAKASAGETAGETVGKRAGRPGPAGRELLRFAIVDFFDGAEWHDAGEAFLASQQHEGREGDFFDDFAVGPAVGFGRLVDGRRDPAVVTLGVFF